MEQAVAQANAGDMAAAEASTKECLARDPDNIRALLNLGTLLSNRKAYADAEHALRRAVALATNVETVTALARTLRAAGKPDEAEGMYLHILGSIPAYAPALLGLAEVYEEKGERTRAVEFFRKAWDAQPEDIEVAIRYASLAAEDNPDEPGRVIATLLAVPGLSNAKRLRVLGALLMFEEFGERMKRGLMPYHAMALDEMFFKFAAAGFAAYRDAAFAAIQEQPNDGNNLIAAMLAHFCVREYPQAEAMLKRLRAAQPGQIWESTTFDNAFHRELAARNDIDLFGTLPPVSDVLMPDFTGENIVYLACSGGYFDSFGLPMLRSLEDRGPGEQVHLHLMEVSDDLIPLIKGICASFRNLTIGVTIERPGFADERSHEARGYYHAVRFIRYFQHLQRHGRALWMMDVDALFNRAPTKLYTTLGANDAAFRARAGRLEPWNQFSAGIVGARATPASLRYFRAIAAYVAHFHGIKRLSWGIDQAAMYSAFVYLQECGAAPTLTFLDDLAMDLGYRDEGILWCSAGIKKFEMLDPNAMPDESRPEGRYHARYKHYRWPG